MEKSLLKNKIIKSAIGKYDNYCSGFSGIGSYITSLVANIGIVKKKFIHEGSEMFDSILAYDKAEVSDTYIGQINMEIVSSFCGPEGLIWGYDIVREDSSKTSAIVGKDTLRKFNGIKIINGENLRKAAKMLFGTREKKHFPFFPGSIVPCAGRFYTKEGPAFLYSTLAIGIPENRARHACVLMEDVGQLKRYNQKIKQNIVLDGLLSVLEIGKNHDIKYNKIFVDFLIKKVKSNEIGCALIAMPYFKLAKKAFNKKLTTQTLQEWYTASKKYFLT